MTERLIGETGSKKRRRFLLLPLVLVSLVALFVIAGAQAVHDGFQLDRDASSTLPAGAVGDDWDRLDDGAGDPNSDDSAGASTFTHEVDGATIFTGGGSKDDLNTTGWKHKNGSVPDKDDLLDAFAARYGDTIYFGADRIDNSGDAAMGFWFFQGNVVAQPGGGFGPDAHENGDILILSDFSGGGSNVTIRVYQWNSPGGAINGTLDLIAGTLDIPADCVGPPSVPDNDNFCGTVNRLPTASPWPFAPKGSAAGTFQPGEFYEGGVDLAFLGLDDECFASYLAETRSSTSVNATLKDFVGGSFEPCTSSLVTTPSNASGNAVSTIEVGGSIYDKGVIQGSGSSATPTGTVDFWLCSPAQLTNGACQEDAQGNDTGTLITDNAPVNAAGVAMSGAANPNTTGTWCWRGEYSGDSNYPPAKDFTTGECFNVVNARISVSPLVATNETGTNHTVTATVQQDTGAGFGSAPDGTTVNFSLLNNSAGAVFTGSPAVSSCTTTGGTCSIQITTTGTGTVDIRATSTFTVGTISVTRTTGSTGNSADANKRFVDAQIDLSPLTDTNGIGENHTITATVQQNDGLAVVAGNGGDAAAAFGPAPDGTTVTFSFSQNTIGATFVGGSTCTTTGGTCSIQITSTTAGTVRVNATTTFNIGPAPVEAVTRTTGTGGLNSADAEKTFVDGTLVWLKRDQAGALLGGATFEVCRTHNWNSNSDPAAFQDLNPDVCVSVLDNAAPDADADNGEFRMNNLILGRYTIRETAAPAGYALDPDTETVNLSTTNPSNAVAGHPSGIPVFVDVRLYKLIVITCTQTGNILVPSVVTLMGQPGSPKDTLGAAPAGLTSEQLCGLGGASYGNLNAGTYNPSVLIPKP